MRAIQVTELNGPGAVALVDIDEPAATDGLVVVDFDAVHGVVNNAGILRDGAFHKMSAENFDAVLKVHLAQFQSDGITFASPPTLREIAQRWPDISDMSNAKPGTSPV